MRNINSVVLAGNLTRDPEVRVGQSTVMRLNLAVSQPVKKGQTWEEKPSYFWVKVFGKQAEYLANHLVKGTKVFVQGSLSQDSYEKDGQKISYTEIIANLVEFNTKTQPQNVQNYYQTPPSEPQQPNPAAAVPADPWGIIQPAEAPF